MALRVVVRSHRVHYAKEHSNPENDRRQDRRQASAASFGAPQATRHGLGDPMQLVALVRAMRPHQWVKNLLLFVPLVTAHRIADMQAWTHALQAFLAMCLTAGAIYIANDLSDLDADRAHRSKSRRPFASGSLPVWAGVSCVPLLLGGALAAGWAGGAAGLGSALTAGGTSATAAHSAAPQSAVRKR